jgi:hypothetical protein
VPLSCLTYVVCSAFVFVIISVGPRPVSSVIVEICRNQNRYAWKNVDFKLWSKSKKGFEVRPQDFNVQHPDEQVFMNFETCLNEQG